MKRVVIESPFAGDITRNLKYARAAVKDSLNRGEAPFASHLIYPQPTILRDWVKEDRLLGMVAGLAWMEAAELVAVYHDLGISEGMKIGIERAKQLELPVEYRSLGAR